MAAGRTAAGVEGGFGMNLGRCWTRLASHAPSRAASAHLGIIYRHSISYALHLLISSFHQHIAMSQRRCLCA